jgi:hypothetical protein
MLGGKVVESMKGEEGRKGEDAQILRNHGRYVSGPPRSRQPQAKLEVQFANSYLQFSKSPFMLLLIFLS